MTKSFKKRVFLFLVLAFSAFLLVWSLKKPKPSPSDTLSHKSIDQIYKEREDKAFKSLQTPGGALFESRKWSELNKTLDPQKDYLQLGEWIRSRFIVDQFKSYSKSDHEQLMELILNTLEKLNPKSLNLAQSLIFQAGRLPTPEPKSKNDQKLENWLNSPTTSPQLKKFALTKLCIAAENPNPKWVQLFKKGFNGNRFGYSFRDWLMMIEETRNEKVKDSFIELLFQSFTKIPSNEQPYALTLMARYAGQNPVLIKKTAFRFLKSSNTSQIESAVRSIGYLSMKKLLTPTDQEEFKRLVETLSKESVTPFVSAKSREIINGF